MTWPTPPSQGTDPWYTPFLTMWANLRTYIDTALGGKSDTGHGHAQLHDEDHAARHATGQPDAIAPGDIGAATSGHTHAGHTTGHALDDLTDVDTAGGSTGDVVTRKADGTYDLQAPAGGSGTAPNNWPAFMADTDLDSGKVPPNAQDWLYAFGAGTWPTSGSFPGDTGNSFTETTSGLFVYRTGGMGAANNTQTGYALLAAPAASFQAISLAVSGYPTTTGGRIGCVLYSYGSYPTGLHIYLDDQGRLCAEMNVFGTPTSLYTGTTTGGLGANAALYVQKYGGGTIVSAPSMNEHFQAEPAVGIHGFYQMGFYVSNCANTEAMFTRFSSFAS